MHQSNVAKIFLTRILHCQILFENIKYSLIFYIYTSLTKYCWILDGFVLPVKIILSMLLKKISTLYDYLPSCSRVSKGIYM